MASRIISAKNNRVSLIATDSILYYSCTIDGSLRFILEHLNHWDMIAKMTWLELAILTAGCSHSCRESGYI